MRRIVLLLAFACLIMFTGTANAHAVAQCRDGRDNDGDGKIDYPADPGCTDRRDNNETDPVPPPPPPPTPTPTPTPTPVPGTCDMSVGCQLISAPAYWTPPSSYDTQFASTSYKDGKGASAMRIANNGNGPGSSCNANLKAQIDSDNTHGIKNIGYVNTSATAGTADTTPRRPLADVFAEIDMWYNCYAIDGIFEDNSGQRSDTDSFHKSVYDHIKQKSGSTATAPNGKYDPARNDYVMMNIAWNFNEYKMQTADIVVSFEDTWSYYQSNWNTYYVAYSPFLTSGAYGPERFAQIIEGTPESAIAQAAQLSKQRNTGWIFIDNDVQGYNNLPSASYWATENAEALKPKQ